MATSGSVNSGGYQGRVLKFEWGTKSTSGNTRVIWYKVTAVGGSSSQYWHHNDYVNINGTRVYTGGDSYGVTTGTVLAEDTMSIDQSKTNTLTVDMHGGIYNRTDNINKTQSWTLDVLIQAPTINSLLFKSKTINSITCSFSVNKADTFYYKLSTQNSWQKGNNNVTSGTFTISNLEPNKSYTINFLARNWISESEGKYKDSTKDIAISTYDIGKISSVNNFNHGDNTIVNITNPSKSNLNLTIKIGNTQIQSKTVSTGNNTTFDNTISFNDTELDNIYKLYGSGNTLTATFILTTAGNYTNSKTCTITLKGNQKTTYVGQNGKKRAKVYVGVNGSVKRAVVWIGNNGRKRCI